MILEGELEIRLKNGMVKRLDAGRAAAEVVNLADNDRHVSNGPLRLIVSYAGAGAKTLSAKELQEPRKSAEISSA